MHSAVSAVRLLHTLSRGGPEQQAVLTVSTMGAQGPSPWVSDRCWHYSLGVKRSSIGGGRGSQQAGICWASGRAALLFPATRDRQISSTSSLLLIALNTNVGVTKWLPQ